MVRRVAVTGLGVVSPLGCTLSSFWDRLIRGESGIELITAFDTTEYATKFGGIVKELDLDAFVPKKTQRRSDPFCHYGLAAAHLAVADCGIDFSKEDGYRAGVMVSSGIGGLQILQDQMRTLIDKGPRRFSPFMIPEMITNILSGMIAIEYGLKGPNFAVVSACASGTHSIGESLRMIQHGDADIMLAGGAEASLCELGVGGFNALKALSTRNDDPQRASRPFDVDRDGFVPAEGAGVIVLEDWDHAVARGAHIYCEMAGYGRTCDAYHMTAPIGTGEGAAKGIEFAMKDAGVTPEEISYINAHGTSTPLNDKCETLAIKGAMGDAAYKTMISSTKSMMGHLLGAAGGVEAVVCALAFEHGAVPPTINYETPDPDCDLDYIPNTARDLKMTACLSNSLGFGGHNATICMKAVK
ncbi:MAG: beta-ketoacyl-[acyl-carrier-protein] synthase II [Spartobacteria bacterium]|nr:beta-ketoacyl-[acyl-carrier-protein] synthase II [Spartobacteria bacterium]